MKVTETRPSSPANLLTADARVERRSKPRMAASFPATVHGINEHGEPFKVDTVIDNISAGGLFLWLPQCLEQGAGLLVVSRMAKPDNGTAATAPVVAMHGTVLRARQVQGGLCGVAMKITRHEFL